MFDALQKITHRVTLLPLLLLLSTACATVTPQIDLRQAGHLDHARAQQTVHNAVGRDDPEDAVQVVDASNTAIDMTQYDTLGTVQVDEPSANALRVRNWIWYNDFESRGRFGWCVWQTPFKMVTLGLWNILPLAWGCEAGNPGDAGDRLEYLSRYGRRVAAEMGGDTVVLTETRSSGDVETSGVSISAPNGGVVPPSANTVVRERHNTGVTLVVMRHRLQQAHPNLEDIPGAGR